MLETHLSQIGLNKREIAVYLEIVRRGKALPATIASITSINRTTVYSIGKKLVNLGLLQEDLGGKFHYLIACSPKALKNILDREERKLNEKRTLINSIAQEIIPLTKNINYSVPRLQFVEEENVLPFMDEMFDLWIKSTKGLGDAWWGFQDKTFIENYQDWIDSRWEKKEPPDIKVLLLTNKSKEEEKIENKYKGREVKYWNQGEFDATTWVAGDYIIMIMTRERPNYLVQIHDPVLARNQRALFAGIWNELNNNKH